MDVDKLKKWLDVAQQFQGENFWADIFESSQQGGKNPLNAQAQAQAFSSNQNPNQSTHGSQSYQYYDGSTERETKPPPSSPPQPAIDIFETETEWIIWVDLPGISKTDIQLNLLGRKLIIKGVAHLPFPNETLIHSERLNGTFERSINMPDNLALNCQPIAKFSEGILEVRLPRDKPKKHQIQID